MLRLLRLVWALFPAASIAAPETVWFAPSTSVREAGQVAMPESVSTQLKLATSSAFHQPFVFAGLSTAAAIVGTVLSIDTRALSVALSPAFEVAVPVTT